MLETAEKNSAQTMLGRGSHFMGDFLPVITISLLKPKLYYMVRSLQPNQSVRHLEMKKCSLGFVI